MTILIRLGLHAEAAFGRAAEHEQPTTGVMVTAVEPQPYSPQVHRAIGMVCGAAVASNWLVGIRMSSGSIPRLS